MINQTLPVNQQAVVGSDGRMTTPWYRYFQNQNNAISGYVTLPGDSLLGNPYSTEAYPSPITIGQGLEILNGQLICTVLAEPGVTSWNHRTGDVYPTKGDYTFSMITSTPTTLAGYGITDALTIQQTMARVSLGF